MYNLMKSNTYDYVNIVKIPREDIEKIDIATGQQPTETLDSYYRRQSHKPNILCNGGFFCMSSPTDTVSIGDPVMTFLDEGVIQSKEEWLKYGVGIVGDKELVYSDTGIIPHARDYISAYPPLIVRGEIFEASWMNWTHKKRCTFLGWNDTDVYIVCADNPGLSKKEAQSLLYSSLCTYAINLDGGGSTRLLVEGKVITTQQYSRPVDNFLCIYLNTTPISQTPSVPTYYRVQLGAFSKKENAAILATEIQNKGFTDAYIVYTAPYYKVQIGAYSIKLNAERMKDRLSSLGYSSFIIYR